jgi:hypothetical protein
MPGARCSNRGARRPGCDRPIAGSLLTSEGLGSLQAVATEPSPCAGSPSPPGVAGLAPVDRTYPHASRTRGARLIDGGKVRLCGRGTHRPAGGRAASIGAVRNFSPPPVGVGSSSAIGPPAQQVSRNNPWNPHVPTRPVPIPAVHRRCQGPGGYGLPPRGPFHARGFYRPVARPARSRSDPSAEVPAASRRAAQAAELTATAL